MSWYNKFSETQKAPENQVIDAASLSGATVAEFYCWLKRNVLAMGASIEVEASENDRNGLNLGVGIVAPSGYCTKEGSFGVWFDIPSSIVKGYQNYAILSVFYGGFRKVDKILPLPTLENAAKYGWFPTAPANSPETIPWPNLTVRKDKRDMYALLLKFRASATSHDKHTYVQSLRGKIWENTRTQSIATMLGEGDGDYFLLKFYASPDVRDSLDLIVRSFVEANQGSVDQENRILIRHNFVDPSPKFSLTEEIEAKMWDERIQHNANLFITLKTDYPEIFEKDPQRFEMDVVKFWKKETSWSFVYQDFQKRWPDIFKKYRGLFSKEERESVEESVRQIKEKKESPERIAKEYPEYFREHEQELTNALHAYEVRDWMLRIFSEDGSYIDALRIEQKNEPWAKATANNFVEGFSYPYKEWTLIGLGAPEVRMPHFLNPTLNQKRDWSVVVYNGDTLLEKREFQNITENEIKLIMTGKGALGFPPDVPWDRYRLWEKNSVSCKEFKNPKLQTAPIQDPKSNWVVRLYDSHENMLKEWVIEDVTENEARSLANENVEKHYPTLLVDGGSWEVFEEKL